MAKWVADASANLMRRIGKSAHELGSTSGNASCPDIWELSNGDFAVIGTVLGASYANRLPDGVSIDAHENMVVIPRSTLIAARLDIPDA